MRLVLTGKRATTTITSLIVVDNLTIETWIRGRPLTLYCREGIILSMPNPTIIVRQHDQGAST